MERAFASGYDPALDLGHNSHQRRKNANGETEEGSMHLVREEQKVVDAILRGEESGKYWLLMGSKGTGKGTM
jgi:ABC-type molybdenum transport system ATPase subunit/photorepair protein PhrA